MNLGTGRGEAQGCAGCGGSWLLGSNRVEAERLELRDARTKLQVCAVEKPAGCCRRCCWGRAVSALERPNARPARKASTASVLAGDFQWEKLLVVFAALFVASKILGGAGGRRVQMGAGQQGPAAILGLAPDLLVPRE
jgi:hypothetical protein